MAEEIQQKVHNKIAKRYRETGVLPFERYAAESFKSKGGETVAAMLIGHTWGEDARQRGL